MRKETAVTILEVLGLRHYPRGSKKSTRKLRMFFICGPSDYDLKSGINPLRTKRRLLYLKTQSVPRCKHFSSLL